MLSPIVEAATASQLGKQSKAEEENRIFYTSTTTSKSKQETAVEVVEKVEITGNLVFMLYLFQGQNFF